jgi:ubiquinone biosynthesis accessory factor UbiJ
MFEAALAASFNHLLQSASWARARLQPFAGKIARFQVGPVAIACAITQAGEVAASSASSQPDVTLGLSPAAFLRLLAGDTTVLDDAEVSGDAELASAIAHVVRHITWDVEEDLSHFVGDIAAHRIVGGARAIDAQLRTAALNLASNLKEYWTEERPLVAKSTQVAEFIRGVDALRNDLERLEQRLARIL